jgi:tetratricopeptide (TPR) repeat protein
MIGLIQVGPQAMADRFAYIPLIGIFMAVTWSLSEAAARIARTRRAGSALDAKWLAVPAIACLFALAILTNRQLSYWHDVPAFWQHTLALTKNNYVAENNLGDYLFQTGKPAEAAAHFRRALAIQPTNLLANLNLAAYEDSSGNMPGAIERYQAVVQSTRDVDIRAAAYTSMAFDYRDMNDAARAQQYFELAVQLAPHRTRAMVGLGLLAEDSGNLAEAVRRYTQAVSVHPSDVTYSLLARALRRRGRLAEANDAASHIADPAAAAKAADSFALRAPH